MERKATISRKTSETDIQLTINLDGNGEYKVDTKIGFFDHMLNLFAKHGNFNLECVVNGDIEVDFHHTVEDLGIVLGEAIKQSIGNKAGIKRYGTFYVPMMETLVRASLDFSGRGFLFFDYEFKNEKVGEFDTELAKEFFFSVASNAGINIHLDIIRGENTHHIIEAMFKAFARALNESVTVIGDQIPSTKGII